MKVKAGQIWNFKGLNSEVKVQGVLGTTVAFRFNDEKSCLIMHESVSYFRKYFEFVRNENEPSRQDKKGVKSDSNKRRYSLLPTGTINEVVDVLEFGSQKYSDNNWQHVNNARTRYYDAALRHIDAWWHGQINDDETGKHHLAHAVCCLLFLMYFDMEREL